MRFEVSGDVRAPAHGFRTVKKRLGALGPVGFQIRTRILESERRHLTTTTFARRKSSTLKRYRYPLESMADEQEHQTMGKGPLNRHGLLFRTLTTPNAPGQRDTIAPTPGGLTVAFGVRARGRVSYGGMQADANGRRLARNPFRFDDRAHREATEDVLTHSLENFGHG